MEKALDDVVIQERPMKGQLRSTLRRGPVRSTSIEDVVVQQRDRVERASSAVGNSVNNSVKPRKEASQADESIGGPT